MDKVFDRVRKKQLIVIVPEGVADRLDLARRIHSMAGMYHCDVIYLAFVDHPENMLVRSRSMVTMKAITSDPEVSVDWELIGTSHWLTRLKEIVQSGDVVVCQEEQRVKIHNGKTVPLQDFLEETLQTPVRTVSGYYNPGSMLIRQWVNSLLFWTGFLAILAGFAFLEIRLHLTIQGIEQKVLLILGMLVAVAAIGAWNSFSSKWSSEPK